MVELADDRYKQHVSSDARHVKSRLGRQRDLRQLSRRLRTLTKPWHGLHDHTRPGQEHARGA
eukprot:4289186-Pyramimonas_sp.AAC.1